MRDFTLSSLLRTSMLAVGLVVAGASLFGQGALAADEEPTARDLLRGTDDVYRGKSSIATVSMNVKTSRWERKLTLQMWSKGTEKSLIRIVAPKKEAGVTTLKVDKDMWNYLPKVDRVIKVPASMMSGSWMGSHFTNDDLVKESRYEDDFTFEIKERPKDGKGRYLIECVPKPDAPVVWGKVLVELSADRLPTRQEFYDERGALVRTMTFSDVQEVSGRRIPMRMKLVPADKPDEYTEIIQDKLELDVEVPESMFSQQALRK